MDRSIIGPLAAFLTPDQIAASRRLMGIDSQLIADRTYFIVESDGALAGCGGWSGRITEYGGDHTPGREPAPLTPGVDAARIRAMYTAPEFLRQGVGRMILGLCEDAARAAGYDRAELVATLGGEPLYRIDDFQQVYFVIDSIDQLKRETLQDFGPIYERLKGADDIAIDAILPTDRVFTRGTQAYAAKGGRFAA